MKKFRSPISYIGGKHWAIDVILSLIPDGTTELVSAFCGGASIELNAAYHRQIKGRFFDICPKLINFWKFFIENPAEILACATEILLKTQHIKLKEKKQIWLADESESLENAALYYLYSKLAWQGQVLSNSVLKFDVVDGSLKWPSGREYYNPKKTDWEQAYQMNVSFGCQDFEKTLTEDKNSLALCDPPYLLTETGYIRDNNNAGKGIFDHHRLNEVLRNRDSWICFYNLIPQMPYVRLAYKGYYYLEFERMSRFHQRREGKVAMREVVILSHNLAEAIGTQISSLKGPF